MTAARESFARVPIVTLDQWCASAKIGRLGRPHTPLQSWKSLVGTGEKRDILSPRRFELLRQGCVFQTLEQPDGGQPSSDTKYRGSCDSATRRCFRPDKMVWRQFLDRPLIG